MYEVKVDLNKCIGCGICRIVCQMDVYELRDEKPVPVNAGECTGCNICIHHCEQKSISVREFSLFEI